MFTSIPQPQRHWGCRINDQCTLFGFKALILQNELLQLIVLVDKGAEIIQFLYKPMDVDFLWHSANNFREPRIFMPTGSSSASSFFDYWTGGWFEVVPNGGPACVYKYAELGNFDETINLPWNYQILEDTPESVKVRLWVNTYRTPFLLQKTLGLKAHIPALFVEENLTNLGKETMDFMWGHHPVVGAPFLDENCRLFAPESKVEVIHDEDGPDHRMGLFQEGMWPIIKDRFGMPMDLQLIPSPKNCTMDNCYLKEFSEGWIAVNNSQKGVGFGLAWDPKVFRYIWIWQAFGGGKGYPWYGRTYNMGIEPWTSYPCVGLQSAVERGTAMQLMPGESLETWLTAVAFTDMQTVNKIEKDGRVS